MKPLMPLSTTPTSRPLASSALLLSGGGCAHRRQLRLGREVRARFGR